MRNLKARHLEAIAWTVAVVALILASARPALAFVSHGGGVHHGAVVVHGRVFVGPLFLGSAFGPAYYPSPVIYPAPVVVQQPAQAYAQAAPSSEYWYYCPDNRAYFPYAQQCPMVGCRSCRRPDPSRPSGEAVRAAGRVAMVALLGVVGCASPVLLSPERVEQIPPGRYDVLAAHSLGGGLDYAAVLFQTRDENHVALAMPGVERRSAAGPAEFVNGRAAGFSAYELRDAANAVRGYLLLPPRSSVRVWDRAAQHELVIMVDSLEGAYQGGGGGGGTGSGAGSGM